MHHGLCGLVKMSVPRPVLRFAPSPNGRLHLGHAFSALFATRAAEDLGGSFLLRIEDIDPTRCKPEFEKGIYDDLHWLGLRWPEPVLRQSTRLDIYRKAATRLRENGLLYPCFCTRSMTQRNSAKDPDGAPIYHGACRSLSAQQVEDRLAQGEPAQWRLKMDRAVAEAGKLMISQAIVKGVQVQWDKIEHRAAIPERWGDVVLMRKDIPTSYHLSVVVDDAEQSITHVTRGMDLEPSTDGHVLLQKLLGLPQPLYAHHLLLQDETGQKLAKSRNSPSLQDLRDAGMTAGNIKQRLDFS